jgi:hypothetical protein
MFGRTFTILLPSIVAALGVCPLSTAVRADEPETVIFALLFDAGGFDGDCLEDPVGIAFGAWPGSNSTQKTLSSTFGEPFGNENLNGVNALYVSRGGVRENVVRGFGSAPPPATGFLRLGPGSDAQVLYCGLVSDNSNIIEPNEFGDLLLVIVAGTVH